MPGHRTSEFDRSQCGRVNWAEVVQALKEIGYDGLFNYEIPGERNCPLEVRNYKAIYLKQTFAYMLEQAEKQ